MEYIPFYRRYVEPFQTCDEDKNYLIDPKVFEECLLNMKNFVILYKIKDQKAIENLVYALGRKSLDIYSFYLLKRIDEAFQNCSENLVISLVLF